MNSFFDFLRGMFDGDGTCYSFWDKRWRSSFMFYIKFCAYNIEYLKWVQSRIKKLININGNINKNTRTWELSYPKQASRELIKAMYYSKDIPCLHRKKISLKISF